MNHVSRRKHENDRFSLFSRKERNVVHIVTCYTILGPAAAAAATTTVNGSEKYFSAKIGDPQKG